MTSELHFIIMCVIRLLDYFSPRLAALQAVMMNYHSTNGNFSHEANGLSVSGINLNVSVCSTCYLKYNTNFNPYIHTCYVQEA